MAELRLSFGNVAETYDRVRPPYSELLLDRAQELLELDARSRVLDLGAGTGRVTRQLAGRFGHVVAVEPDERMRALHGEAIAGSAEAIPLEDASVDAVFVGEAFHWFDPEAAIPELARVLRPRGGVALLWNHWWSDGDDRTSNSLDPPLPAEAQELFDEVYVRSGRAAAREAMADPLLAFSDARFEPLAEEAFPRSELLSRREVVDLFTTVSSVASLPPAERDELKRTLAKLLEPSYRLRIVTELHWTRRV